MPNTPGSVVRLQVAVFDNNLFADYASAFAGNGIAGRSIVFDYMIPTQPPAPGSDSMVNFSSFVVYFVPEPSVLALGVVGLSAVFLFRRRRLR